MLSRCYEQSLGYRNRHEHAEAIAKSRRLTIRSGPLASAWAPRLASAYGLPACSVGSEGPARWLPRAATCEGAAVATPQPGRDHLPAGPGSAAPPAASSCPTQRSWWQWLAALVASAGRIVALALVVASLVLASPSMALAKGSGGRVGGRSFGSGGGFGGSSSRSYGGSSSGGGRSSSFGGGAGRSSRGSYSGSALGGGGYGGFSIGRTMMSFPYNGIYMSLPGSSGSTAAVVGGASCGGSLAAAEAGRVAVASLLSSVFWIVVIRTYWVYMTHPGGLTMDALLGRSGSGSGSHSGSGSGSEAFQAREPVAVCRVQVAVLAAAREELQAKFERLAEDTDTRSPKGLHTLLHESVLLLLRHREVFAYGAVQETSAAGEAAAEAAFDRLSLSERSRFKEETLSNVQGRKQRALPSAGSEAAARRREEDELVVVTLLLSARPPMSSSSSSSSSGWPPATPGGAGASASLLGVRSAAAVRSDVSRSGGSRGAGGDGSLWSDVLRGVGIKGGSRNEQGNVEDSGWVERLDGAQGLSRALLALSGVRPEQVLAVEVMWTPEAPGDTFSRTDLLEDYLHLQPL